MKRLLAQIGITAFSALAVAFYLPETVKLILLAAAAAASIVLFIIPKTRRKVYVPAMALAVVFSLLANIGWTELFVMPIQNDCSGSEKRIEATLSDEVYRAYSRFYYRLDTESIDGEKINTKLLLKTSRPIDIEPIDRIIFTADIRPTENKYYLSKQYYLTADVFDENFDAISTGDRTLYYYAIQLRRAFRKALREYLPEDVSALCSAVFVGDKYALDADVKADFKYAGASHFIVVSGLHFTMICLGIMWFLKKLKLNRYVAVSVTLFVLLIYMAVTGFQPSVMRSGIMMVVLIASRYIKRIIYPLNSLGLAGIVLPFIFSPYGMGDIGLILSFAATFAILTWATPIYERIKIKSPDNKLKKAVNYIIGMVSVCLAANILVFPISVIAFGAFSSVTLISAVVLYVPIEMILILSLLICLLFYLGPLRYIALVLSWALYGLGRFVLWSIDFISSLPFSYVYIGDTYVYVWLGVTIALGLIVIALKNKNKFLPVAALISAIVFLGGMITAESIKLDTLSLEVYDCGDGIAVGLNNRGSLYLMAFDVRSKEAYSLLEKLSRRYGSAELAVCSTKSDVKNYSRLSDKEFAISRCLMYDSDTEYKGSGEIYYYNVAEEYILGDGIVLSLAGYKNKLMSFIQVNGVTVSVLPENYPLKAIPDEYRNADIIVLAEACDGYDELYGGKLIISGDIEESKIIRAGLTGCFDSVEYTYSGDVTVDLR